MHTDRFIFSQNFPCVYFCYRTSKERIGSSGIDKLDLLFSQRLTNIGSGSRRALADLQNKIDERDDDAGGA